MNETETSKDASFTENVKDRSLKASGLAYLVGDAALVTAGILEGDYKTARAGALYGLGGLALARYGNPKTEKRIKLLYQDLADYLKAQGIEIPKGSQVDTVALAKDGGVIEHIDIERFLYKHPSQVLNSLFTVGGLQLMHGGINNHRPWKTASGALVTAGALSGLLIKERVKDTEDGKDTGMFGKMWHWVQEKPLRISGSLYMANNVTMTVDALQQRKKNPVQATKGSSGYLFQLLMVASYVVANGLLAISNKDNTSSKNAEKERAAAKELEQAAAEVIAAQPQEVQQQLIKKVADYLSTQSRVSIPAEELAMTMQKEVDSRMTDPLWQQRVNKTFKHHTPQIS